MACVYEQKSFRAIEEEAASFAPITRELKLGLGSVSSAKVAKSYGTISNYRYNVLS